MFSIRDFHFNIPIHLLNVQSKPEYLFPKEIYKSSIIENNNLHFTLTGSWVSVFNFLKTFYSSTIGLKVDKQVKTCFAPMRKHPSHASEMVSQLLKGEIFYSFYSMDNFDFGYSEDGYWGYVSSHQLVPFENEYFRDFQLNPKYPIGSKTLNEPINVHIEQIINDLFNTPYLWGGRSNWGIDCSGLSQLLMLSQNIILPRDAYQQADFGEFIPFGKHQFNDLAFFGKNQNSITHVGFILDSNTILHAYGYVRKDILLEKGIYHIDYEKITHELVGIKRYPHNFNFWNCLQS